MRISIAIKKFSDHWLIFLSYSASESRNVCRSVKPELVQIGRDDRQTVSRQGPHSVRATEAYGRLAHASKEELWRNRLYPKKERWQG